MYLASSIAHSGAAIGNVLNQNQKRSLVFITTASEVDEGDCQWVKDDRKGLEAGGFEIIDYSITGKTKEAIEADLAQFDVIHVNGGNTFYLFLQMVRSGFDQWVTDAIKKEGKIYIGSSAGAVVASPNIWITDALETKTYGPELRDIDAKGVGLVDVITLPHWGSDHFKDLYLNKRLENAYKAENKIVLLNDYQFLVTDGRSYEFMDISLG